MTDFDRFYYTNLYNWLITPLDENIFIIYIKNFSQTFVKITYHKNESILVLPSRGGLKIYCDSFDYANNILYNLLKVNRWVIEDRHRGRYFKLKKLIKNDI